MSQIPTISSVVAELATLKAGYRAWFWLCPAIEAPHPPLLIKTFRADPDMQQLREDIDRLPTPEDAETCMGFLSVTQDGTLQFGSSILSLEQLQALAAWATDHVQDYPMLCRLKDAIFVNLSSKGIVVEKIEDKSLWSGLPTPVVPGTMMETASILEQLKPGNDAWFYLCHEPSGSCFLSIASSQDDPQGVSFGENIAELQLRFRAANRAAKGLLRVSASGNLIFITPDSPADAAFIINGLVERYPGRLASLQQARIIQLDKGSFGKTIIMGSQKEMPAQNVPKLDLQRLQEVLEGIDGSASLYFWLGQSASILVLETDKDALKRAAKAAGGKGIHGKARLSKKGNLEFQVKQSAPDFILSLAAFTKENIHDWPALKKLRGARMTQRNSEGEIIDRQKNDDVWSFIK